MAIPNLYYSILQAVQTAVSGLRLTFGENPAPVFLRKLPHVNEELPTDSVPCICVCPDDREEVQYKTFGANVWVWYPVQVVIVGPGNQDTTANLDTWLSWRAQIRDIFQKPPLAGVSEVWDVEIDPKAVIDASAVNDNYDYSILGFRFRTSELR